MGSPARTLTFEGVHGDHDVFLRSLTALLGDGTKEKDVIDLCCNVAPYMRTMPFRSTVLVDVEPQTLPDRQHMFVQADCLGDHPVFDRHYDVCTCLDGIEHLTKADGRRLLERCRGLADRQVFFTPLHAWMLEYEGTERWEDPKSHKCVWTPEDLPEYAHLVYPVYHKTLDIGAFFFWTCPDLDDDFDRVQSLLCQENRCSGSDHA